MEIKKALSQSLILLGKLIMPNTFWAPSPDVHYEIQDYIVNEENTRLNLILPRGLGKTTFVGELEPIRHIFLKDDNEPRVVVIVSKTQAHSVNRIMRIQNLMEYSTPFKQLFGYWGEHTARRWRTDEVILKDGSVLLARGMGQPIRGVNYEGVRPTLVVIDDPQDENNTKTDEAMNDHVDWLLKGVVPALDKRIKSRVVIIGTPLDNQCIVEQVAKMPDWKTVRKSYLIEEDNKAISIWPEMQSVEELINERTALEATGRAYVFYQEKQCQIIGNRIALIKEEYLRYWDGTFESSDEGPYLNVTHRNGELLPQPEKLPVNVYIGVDPASSTARRADYSVVFAVGYTENNEVYCLEYFRDRVSPMKLVDKIFDMFNHYKPMRVGIESTGYQEMLREYVKQKTDEQGIYIPGLELGEKPRNQKTNRLESIQPNFARRKVVLKSGMEAFKTELLTFPNGEHDDTLDGYYYATRRMRTPYHIVDPPKRDVSLDKRPKEREKSDAWMKA